MECDKKELHDSSDVIIIDCVEDITHEIKKKRKHHHKKKCEHRRQKKLDSYDNKRDGLKITQEVGVNKEIFSCIINLNTNISERKDNKRKCQRKHHKKPCVKYSENRNKEKHHSICKPRYKERIVPTCSRSNCQRIKDSKLNYCKHKESKHKHHHHRHQRRNEQNKKFKHDHNTSISKKTSQKRCHDKSRIMLSPISSSPLNHISGLSLEDLSNSPLYEDVSLESFRYSDNELDTLIKRTKERERRTQKKSDKNKPLLYTSTPVDNQINISSDDEIETIFSGPMDISIHSQATLVLEPQFDTIYSPLSSDYDFTGEEIQHTSGYSYQNRQNFVQCASNLRISGVLENNNEHNNIVYRVDCPFTCTNTDLEGHPNNVPYSPSSPVQSNFASGMTEYNYNFPDCRVKLEPSYSPINTTDTSTNMQHFSEYNNDVISSLEYNLKLEDAMCTTTPDYLTSGLPKNNMEYHVPQNCSIKCENPQCVQITHDYSQSGLSENNNVYNYPGQGLCLVKSKITQYSPTNTF